MKPRLYVGTAGLSVWHSDDLGETFTRMLADTGLYSETRVWALSYSPARPDELLAGTDSGIHRLDIAKRQWTHVPSDMDTLCIWSIAQSPRDPNLLLAGTRPPTIFRSIDGGKTWSNTNAPLPETCPFVLNPRVTKIEFDPKDANLVWAGLEIGGVWRSRDAGKTWQSKSKGLISEDVHDVCVVHNGARLLYATTNKGVHISRDDGDNWELQAPFDSPSQYSRTMKPSAIDNGTVWLCNGDGPPGSWGKLLRSRDYGQHWEDAHLPGKLESSAWCVATNPTDPKLIFAAAALGQYYRSKNGGEQWEVLPRRLSETRALAWVPV
ncbi:MAG: WD40/YVTN/BNR-like repeat-containing protein [Stellaceae bacterium]